MKLLTENKGLAEVLSSWLGVAAIIVGGAYGVLEYIEHKQAVKVERSLAYVEHYRTGNAGEAKLFLNRLLADNHASLVTLLGQAGQDAKSVSSAYSEFVLQMTGSAEAQRNLEIAFSFYEEIAICVKRELCDGEVISSFFINDARSLFNSFYPYVCSLRQQWKNDTVYLKIETFYGQAKRDICAP